MSSKARLLADLFSDSQITASEIVGLELNSIQEGNTVVQVSDTGSGGKVVVRVDGADNAEFNANGMVIPKGTTAERDPAAVVGSLRYNTTTGFFESFTGSGWGSIATPPSITSITPSNFNGEAGATFTVNGAFFDTDTTAVFKGADGTEYAAATVTFVSSAQITLTNATNLPVANEPFKVRVTNGAGLSVDSTQGIDAGSVPAFTTAAGNIATTTRWDEAVSVTVQATDAESTISGYAVTQGNLPAGLTLDGATGAITGTSTEQTTTTYTFTIEATDSVGNTNTRQFNIQIVNAAPVWSSPAEGATEELTSNSAGSITLNATDPEGEAVSYTSGTLPAGLSLSGNVISGTPTVQANNSVAVTASDGFASSVRNFFINVLIAPTGPDPFSNFAITSSGTDTVSYSDFNNPDLIANAVGDFITDTQYWHRLRLRPNLTGSRRLIFRTQLPATPKDSVDIRKEFYNADVQIAGVIHRSGTTTTEYYFTDARDHGFESITSFTTGAGSNTQPTSWSSISTTAIPNDGKFGLNFNGAATGSTLTARLTPPSPVADGASTLSFMYSETSSPVAFGDSVWMRSPAITIATGDIIEILMGEDAVSAESFTVFVE